MKPDIKSMNSRVIKWWRCFIFFYLVLFAVLGIAFSLFACYLLVFRREIHGLSSKVILYFIFVPTLFVIASTIVGWRAIKKKNTSLIKIYAVVMGISVILEISGAIWYFSAHEKIQETIIGEISKRFSRMTNDKSSESYWNKIQKKYQCCGLNGPTDYRSKSGLPFSCCGSNTTDLFQGSCTMVWQKGCSEVISAGLSKDVTMMGLIVFAIAILQTPGVFFSWCFANRISNEAI